MCFSATQSAAFAVMGLVTVAILRWRGRSWKYTSLAAYFTVMEVIQLLQYMVIDQCDSKVNQLLTWLAYVHVSLQPVVFNEFVWGCPQAIFNKPVISKEADLILHWTVRRLATAASGLLILKGLPAFLQLLGLSNWPLLHSLLGPSVASYLTSAATCCGDNPEMLCGKQLCSFYGKFHVGWSVPSLPHSYYIPTAFIHGFFFFLPALVCGGPPQAVLSIAAFFTGPVLTEWILGGDVEARQYEWASIWCMFSLGQVLLLFAVELIGSQVLLGALHDLPTVEQDYHQGGLFTDLLGPAKAVAAKQAGSAAKRAAGRSAALGLHEGGSGSGSDGDGSLPGTPRRSTRLQHRSLAATASNGVSH